MKVPMFIVTGCFAAIIALQAWQVNEILSLKVNVATLTAKIEMLGGGQITKK